MPILPTLTQALSASRLFRMLVLSTLLVALSGCNPHHFFGPLIRTGVADAEKQSPKQSLLAVEFTDHGAFYKPSQRTESIDAVRARLRCDTLIVAFAHGWHHNADPNDAHLKAFESELLVPLSQSRSVLGIYIGWRGETSRVPLLRELTFFGTKDAAETVGSSGVTELLLRVDAEVDRKRQMCAKESSTQPQFVIIGHSLGGLVIYSALSQLLVERFLQGGVRPKTFGDLVVLVNPAFEASRFRILHELSTQNSQYSKSQPTLLLLAQTEADFATTSAFGMSRFFAKMFEDVPLDSDHPDSAAQSRTAVGHYVPFRTHCLVPRDNTTSSRDFAASCQASCDGAPIFGNAYLCPVDPLLTSNPIRVVRVPAALMNGHSDIWSVGFKSFLLDFVAGTLGDSKPLTSQSTSAP